MADDPRISILRSIARRSRHQLKKQLLEISLSITIAQLVESAARLDAAFADDRDASADLFDLTHDVRRVEDALALITKPFDVLQDRPRDKHVKAERRFVKDEDRR